jgi:hypothetical protein
MVICFLVNLVLGCFRVDSARPVKFWMKWTYYYSFSVPFGHHAASSYTCTAAMMPDRNSNMPCASSRGSEADYASGDGSYVPSAA